MMTVVKHSIRLSSGSGRSYFDADGHRKQVEGLYVVTLWCDCGWRGQARVEEIDAFWAAHRDGGGERAPDR